jgi:hypothetical protein
MSQKKITTHPQPRVHGTIRFPRHTAILPELDQALQYEAKHYGVTKSWIVALALARHLDVPTPRALDYRREPWRHSNNGHG